MKKFTLMLLIVVLTSCVDDKVTPEGALKSFVEDRFEKVLSKEDLLSRVTGKLQQGIENTSEEEYKKVADLSNMKRDSFKILSKSCQEKKCFITYAISYKSKDDDKTTAVTDVKKIAELQQIEGKWLIADVSNVKTYVEAMEPINPLQ